jgi:hypothetical protein
MRSSKGNVPCSQRDHGVRKRGQDQLFQSSNEVGNEVGAVSPECTSAGCGVLEMAESPADKYAGQNKLAERFGGQTELERVVPTPSVIPASEIKQSDLLWAAGGSAWKEANNETAAN